VDDGEAQVRLALRAAVEFAQELDPLAWLRRRPGEVDDVDVLIMVIKVKPFFVSVTSSTIIYSKSDGVTASNCQ
jgi:hypothetical protein